MKHFNILVTLLLAAGPCAAMTQDIIMIPEGQVEARASAASEWVPVNSGVKIKAGAEIRTAKDTKAGVIFPDGSRFQLGNSTLFTVEDTGKKKAGFLHGE